MKILIADAFPDAYQQELTSAGHQITYLPSLQGDELRDAISDNEVLVVRSTKVEADHLAAANLRLVIRAGAGTNTIACDVAAEHNIRVCNVPGANSIAVAELVMGLIICADRRIPSQVADLKGGMWNKKKYSTASGLFGKTLGILGLGAIGFAVAERARAFGIKVISVANPKRSPAALAKIKSFGIKCVKTREQLLNESDIVSLHLPANAHTENIVDGEFLKQMKDGATLINAARGNLVDEDALLAAMDDKNIRVGLDVYQGEPSASEAEFKSKIVAHLNCIGSHHIGASTEQAQLAVAAGVIQIIKSYQNGGELLNCVN